MKIGFLHIGKTGGSSLRSILESQAAAGRFDLVWHRDDVTLSQALRSDPTVKLGFVFRDPCERFVSAFWSRLRMGRPRYSSLWSADEAIAFQWFATPNALAEALFSEDERMMSAARFAMNAISHLKRNMAWTLGDTKSLARVEGNIHFACDLSELDDRLDDLLRSLGGHAVQDPQHLNVQAEGRSSAAELSATAHENLERFWPEEFALYDFCRATWGGASGRELRDRANEARDAALTLYRSQDWQAAVDQCDAHLAVCPLDLQSLLLRARALGHLGEPEAALAAWESVLDAAPDSLEALVTLARRAFSAQDYDTATRHLNVAARLSPGDAQIARLRLATARASGDRETIAALIDAAGGTPQDIAGGEMWRDALDVWIAEGREAAAEALIAAREKVAPGDPEGRLALAHLRAAQHRVHDVVDLVRTVESIPDRNLRIALCLAAEANGDSGALGEQLNALTASGARGPVVEGLQDRANRLSEELRSDDPAGHDPATITALLGVSFCGSTFLGSVLGSLPDVAHVGESHRMIFSAIEDEHGDANTMFDFDTGDPETITACLSCGPACSAFPHDFRRALRDDPTNWYFRLARQLGAAHLVAGDKQLTWSVDPLQRFNAVILFKNPEAAFQSNWKRRDMAGAAGRHGTDPGSYGDAYARTYRQFMHMMRPRGTVLHLAWDRFLAEPEAHLNRLCAVLGLTPDMSALKHRKPDQHTFGGNRDVREQFAAVPDKAGLRRDNGEGLTDADRAALANHEPMQNTHADLLSRYEADFRDLGAKS